MQPSQNKQVIGWREWVGLPELGIKKIKAKIDTGARTSSLDAKNYELIEQQGVSLVRFQVPCGSRENPIDKTCIATVVEHRDVTNSGGQVEERIVISTAIQIGTLTKDIEVTLTRRANMKFRMLLGRTAIREEFTIDAGASYLTGTRRKRTNQ